MKILVTFALDEEFAPWREMRKFERRKSGASDAYWAQIGDGEVSVMLTGVGAKQPSFKFPRDIWVGTDALGFCVSSGLAGALRPDYRLGQVLAARSVSAFSHVGGAAGQALECSSSLLSFASECGATVANRFYTSGRVIARAEEKRQLGHSSDAVEMESAGILRAAMEEGIPAVAIRAISDLAEEDLPLDMSGVFNEEGRVSVPRVIGQVALHPASIPSLVKLGKQSKLAAESLARFMDQYVGMVAGRMKTLESKVEIAAR